MHLGLAGRLARAFIDSKLTPILIAASVALGIWAVWRTPREEEPQIIVPMVDVIVQAPGLSAEEVVERVSKPMEALLWEIPGVEYIYTTSSPGQSLCVVRFYVGQNEEDSMVRLREKLQSNYDRIPQGVSPPILKLRSIDDIPILALTLHGGGYSADELRLIATRLETELKQIPKVSEIGIIGGRPREMLVELDANRMAGRGVTVPDVAGAIRSVNERRETGAVTASDQSLGVRTGRFLFEPSAIGEVPIAVADGSPVRLKDVADVRLGRGDADQYVFFGRPNREGGPETFEEAVTLTLAKRKGTNASDLANAVLAKVEHLKGSLIPSDVQVTVTRDYGETAKEKSNELLFHMAIAVVGVTLLIALALGLKESLVVLIAIPVTLALTMAVMYFYGYTLNRITLFALIFSIGILVDDAIVVVENIVRHIRMKSKDQSLIDVSIRAVDEVGNPTILATFAVIAAILPLAFVGGLMGPYMRPIPINASSAMMWSLLVAFIVTPWAAVRILRNHKGSHDHGSHDRKGLLTRLYLAVMGSLLRSRVARFSFFVLVGLMLLGSMGLIATKFVVVKMLPFDNKSEFQVIVDMPEGSSLEKTAAVTKALADVIATVPEVTDYQLYIGTAGPYNFNGLVRHYFLRRGPHVADIQVNLVSKAQRKAQSHDIAKRLRPQLLEVGRRMGANVKVAEVPPGPPVLSTLVAEVYGPTEESRIAVASQVREIMERTEGVTDVDWYVEADRPEVQIEPDFTKASLTGVRTDDIHATVTAALSGLPVGLAHRSDEEEDVRIVLRFPREQRSDAYHLESFHVRSAGGLTPLSSVTRTVERPADKSRYHKNLMPVTYVIGDVTGRQESPVYAILAINKELDKLRMPDGSKLNVLSTRLPETGDQFSMKWDGEWHITYEVFRDLGIAFAAVLVIIYMLVVASFQNFITPFVIMAPIPLTLIGILPAHGLMGAFFTATSMIGFIAGAGIIVRNSIILVDFIELRLSQGLPLEEAVLDAGVTRFRPMLLTAAAVIVGSSVILFDPIFQGLAIALMAGEIASTLISRLAVPALYYMTKGRQLRRSGGV
ncbi:MAG: multidrug transporter AcrB [Fimbriimonadales bacterium]